MSNLYWGWGFYDDDIQETGFTSREAAIESANEFYAENIVEYEAPRNNELFEDEYWVFSYEPTVVSYTHYHGDSEEHGLKGNQLI